MIIKADEDWKDKSEIAANHHLKLAVKTLGRKAPSTVVELVSSSMWQSLHQVCFKVYGCVWSSQK